MALAMRPERCDSSKLTDGWMVGWLEWYLNDRAMKMNESRVGSPSSSPGKNATHTGGLQKNQGMQFTRSRLAWK